MKSVKYFEYPNGIIKTEIIFDQPIEDISHRSYDFFKYKFKGDLEFRSFEVPSTFNVTNLWECFYSFCGNKVTILCIPDTLEKPIQKQNSQYYIREHERLVTFLKHDKKVIYISSFKRGRAFNNIMEFSFRQDSYLKLNEYLEDKSFQSVPYEKYLEEISKLEAIIPKIHKAIKEDF